MITFTQFLKNNNVNLKDFEANKTNPQWAKSFEPSQEEMDHPAGWIQFAFRWELTTQGYDYWFYLNRKWLQTIHKIDTSQIIYDLKILHPEW
jgi:hypothetical protein